jgi:hypothetical protein
MTKHTFTAPQDGQYHIVTGQTPHLLYTECTARCGTLTDGGEPVAISVELDTSAFSEEFLADLASPIQLEPRATPIRDRGRQG